MDLKTLTVLVYDHGLFFPVAQKLSESFGRTLYFTPWEDSFPTSNDTLLGSGFHNVERIDRLWTVINEVDLFVFTDIYSSDLQEYLRSIGKRVWGSGDGDALEMYRYDFIQHLKKLGLDTTPTELVIGIDNLRKHLKKVEDKYVKVDAMTRGDLESFHHINIDITNPVLDKLAFQLGPKQETIRFIVQDPIKASKEIGYDGYTMEGEFPDECMFGIEVKDKGYVGEVRKYKDLPKEITDINDALSDTLKAYGYRGWFSTEIRVGEDGKNYFIDATCRMPSPPTALILEIYENIGEIMYGVAGGEMIKPTFNAKYGAEIICTSDFAREGFCQIFFPEKDDQWIKQSYIGRIGDKTYVVPQKWINTRVCECVSIGDTLDIVISELKDRMKNIQGHEICCELDVLDGAVSELKKL